MNPDIEQQKPIAFTTELDAIYKKVEALRNQLVDRRTVAMELLGSKVLMSDLEESTTKLDLMKCLTDGEVAASSLSSIEEIHFLATSMRRIGRTNAHQESCRGLIVNMNMMLDMTERIINRIDVLCAGAMLNIATTWQSSETVQP